MDTHTFTLPGGWELRLEGVVGSAASNFVLSRPDGKFYHMTMVMDNLTLPDGIVKEFPAPMTLEHDQGSDKIGDVVLQFRKHPHTGRFMVQVEQENAFWDETKIEKIFRAVRSSVDNIAQAVKKTVFHNGWIRSNPRRIGGKPIKTHHVVAGWAPQIEDQMMDVYDYAESLDSMGLATFLKALHTMPDNPAGRIYKQMRTPPNGNGGK